MGVYTSQSNRPAALIN